MLIGDHVSMFSNLYTTHFQPCNSNNNGNHLFLSLLFRLLNISSIPVWINILSFAENQHYHYKL